MVLPFNEKEIFKLGILFSFNKVLDLFNTEVISYFIRKAQSAHLSARGAGGPARKAVAAAGPKRSKPMALKARHQMTICIDLFLNKNDINSDI